MTPAVTCGDLRPGLIAWLEGRLSPSDCHALRAHLRGCAACSSLLDDDTASALFLRHCSPAPLPPDQAQQLRQRIVKQLADASSPPRP